MSAFDLRLPRMATIRQSLYHAPLGDAGVVVAVQREFARIGLLHKIQAGQTIAIGAGSRGVASINLIIKTLVEEVKRTGANPFVFPAMGSHGGYCRRTSRDAWHFGDNRELYRLFYSQ